MAYISTLTTAYRFMSLEPFNRVADIFQNNRLHASKYSCLNDPTEGYFHASQKSDKNLLQEIAAYQDQWRILCFSKKYNDVLLWAHYADGFRGICIKVEIQPCGNEMVFEVNYDDFPLYFSNEVAEWTYSLSQNVFQEKAKPWKYEKEIRFLTQDEFVS